MRRSEFLQFHWRAKNRIQIQHSHCTTIYHHARSSLGGATLRVLHCRNRNRREPLISYSSPARQVSLKYRMIGRWQLQDRSAVTAMCLLSQLTLDCRQPGNWMASPQVDGNARCSLVAATVEPAPIHGTPTSRQRGFTKLRLQIVVFDWDAAATSHRCNRCGSKQPVVSAPAGLPEQSWWLRI